MLKELCRERQVMPIWNEKEISWEERRKEIIELLCEEEYGHLPAELKSVSFEVLNEEISYGGKVILRQIQVNADFGEFCFSFPIHATIPTREGKHPFFVHINFRNCIPDKYMPIEEICDRGYALISFCYNDVSIDRIYLWQEYKTNDVDVYDLIFKNRKREPNHCGRIRLWAWAASRALDYALTLDCLDTERVAVVGHSRLGKTALLAGALDERFACAISNESGCSGAAISRKTTGETVDYITKTFPHWFCENYFKYRENEDGLPFDQHFLLAAMAPRKVYVASAKQDAWADPTAEFLSAYAATEVYEKLGVKGLVTPDRLPEAGECFHEGNVAYHMREGSHFFSREDWNYFMDYMDMIPIK